MARPTAPSGSGPPLWTQQLTHELLHPTMHSNVTTSGESSMGSSNRNSSHISGTSLERQKVPLLARPLSNKQHKRPTYQPALSTIDPTPKSTPSPPLNLPELWSDLAKLSERASPPLRNRVDIEKGFREPPSAPPRQCMHDVGAVLFLFGFLCPVLWWIGSFWPRQPDRLSKTAHRWQMINRLMSLGFSILLVLLLIAFGVWYSKSK
ncbi:hypothetical protein BC940DRAFT_309143 [Gongronella butleri]|nr:hypothetical protein BC940DRAFT_309143 [Gongronella butleri]